MAASPKTVDEYLEIVSSGEARACLTHLRKVILEAAPEAQECIKYNIPSYIQNGMVISFAAFKNHCSLFPGHTVRDFAEQLKAFKVVNSTIQFPPGKPPPDDLVRAMVKARVKENSSSE